MIVSEPLGFLLVHERMLESFVTARERFLKPGGLMMPSRGTIHFAPFTDEALHTEQLQKAQFWTQNFYGIDLRPLAGAAMDEYARARGARAHPARSRKTERVTPRDAPTRQVYGPGGRRLLSAQLSAVRGDDSSPHDRLRHVHARRTAQL